MDQVKIRKATPADLEQLLVFEQSLIKAERPFDPTLKPDPINYYDLKAMLAASHIYLVVGESGNKIIASGYARIESAKPFLKHKDHAYLGFMFVLPEHRGKGINKSIMGELKKWGRSQGLTEFRLEVYHENESAVKAYEKAGFKRHMIEMRLNTEDE